MGIPATATWPIEWGPSPLSLSRDAVITTNADPVSKSEAPNPFKEPLPHPDHWRAVVGAWSIEMRQEWADWAETLQQQGHDWRRAEFVAFAWTLWPAEYGI